MFIDEIKPEKSVASLTSSISQPSENVPRRCNQQEKRQPRHSPVSARYKNAAPPGNASATSPFVNTPRATQVYAACHRHACLAESRAVEKKYSDAAISRLSSTSGIRR